MEVPHGPVFRSEMVALHSTVMASSRQAVGGPLLAFESKVAGGTPYTVLPWDLVYRIFVDV